MELGVAGSIPVDHPKDMQQSNEPKLTVSDTLSPSTPNHLSPFTEALIRSWQSGGPKPLSSTNKISVSQTVSFLAFIYEKMRNAVEFREEHLIRRASIERIINRRMLLNENGRDIADVLIKELLWARYYENNTIGEEKIQEVQICIDKYFFLRNEISTGRPNKEKEEIASFILSVLSCEIEEMLSSYARTESFTNFVYQLLRHNVSPFDGNVLEKDIQIYIAVERAFVHSDDAVIKYHLLKLMLPQITEVSWKTADKIIPKFYDVYKDIKKSLDHPLADKTRNFVKKQIPPYLILQDIFKQNEPDIVNILTDENKLKQKVDEACRKRYDETRSRLRRTGVRSFIYIILTKVVFAFILELPYDLYVVKSVNYIPILINVIFPPILMGIIIMSVSIPGDENTRRIFNLIKSLIVLNPDKADPKQLYINIGKKPKLRSPFFTAAFSILYLLTYLISFGTIVYILTKLNFNPVSQAIFIFFVTLVTFFAFSITSLTQEYLAVDRDGPLTPVVDFFFLPIIRVGQWLSGEVLTKFNFLKFLFDFIIEMPLKAIVEVIEEWISFVRLKKEEMV